MNHLIKCKCGRKEFSVRTSVAPSKNLFCLLEMMQEDEPREKELHEEPQ